MLVLTRRINEVLMIGDDVKITILDVKGNQVRIGIDAPKDVSVHREEIYLKIKQEKKLFDEIKMKQFSNKIRKLRSENENFKE